MLSLPQNMSVIIYLRLSFGVSLIMQVTNCCGPTQPGTSTSKLKRCNRVLEGRGQLGNIYPSLFTLLSLHLRAYLLNLGSYWAIVLACFVQHVTMKWLWNNKISFRLLFLRCNKRDNNEQGTLITCITGLTLMEITCNWWPP